MNNALEVAGLVLLCLLLLSTFAIHSAFFPAKREGHAIVRQMAYDAVIIALLIIMTFVPNMGFIFVTPFISFTLLHIPVLVGACLFGAKRGAIYGLVFGLCSYLQALLQGSGFNLLFAVPWTAIPPRVLFGFFAGLAFSFIRKVSKSRAKGLYLGLASCGLTLFHTLLVFLTLYIFYPNEVTGFLSSTSPVAQGTALTFLACIGLGALGEMALAGAITPSLCLAISKATGGRKESAAR